MTIDGRRLSRLVLGRWQWRARSITVLLRVLGWAINAVSGRCLRGTLELTLDEPELPSTDEMERRGILKMGPGSTIVLSQPGTYYLKPGAENLVEDVGRAMIEAGRKMGAK